MTNQRTNRISRFRAQITLEVDNAGEMVLQFSGPGPGDGGVEALGDVLKRHADRLAEKVWDMEAGALDKAHEAIALLEKEKAELRERLATVEAAASVPPTRQAVRPRRITNEPVGHTAE